MSNIASAWNLFRKKYYENESNIYEARIFGNPGILIDNKSSNLERNWVECLRKIWGLIHYWSNFRLSITGRVMVTKTFLISQATFYMGIIPSDKKKLMEMEKAINGYVCGGLKIAQDRRVDK